jgi:hypothetical protein
MSALALSVLPCLVSALWYAVAALLQERVAVSARRPTVHSALRSGLWWAALALNGGGGLLHVLALRWGPLTLVQPLGALTIVFALPLSALSHGRGARRAGAGRAAWAGAGLVAGGLAVLTSLVNPVVASLIGVAVMGDGFRYGATGLALVVAAAAAAVGLPALVGDGAGREGAGRREGPGRVASGVPRASPGEHVPCLSAHARESPDVTRGRSCRKNPYVS